MIMSPDFNALQAEMQYHFRDAGLLRMALTHPSVAHERGRMVKHNQRLEFLGDAVLGLVLTREVYEKFPEVSEGPLTKARAQLINRRTLAEQARQMGLQNHLILSRGEEANLGRGRASALADAFEALIGAVFLDGGFEEARGFVLRCFHRAFGEMKEIPTLDNPKGELQELLQAKSTVAPQYEMVRVNRPGSRPGFRVRGHSWRSGIGPRPGQKQEGGRERGGHRGTKEMPRRNALIRTP